MRLEKRTRTTVAVAGGLVLAVALGGCGAGDQPDAVEQVTFTGGASGVAGSMLVRDAKIVFSGPIPGDTVYRPGDTVPLQLTIVNDGTSPDRLVAVRSPIATDGSITGDATVPGGHTLVAGYAEPVAGVTLPRESEIDVALVGVTTPIRSGLTYPVGLVFERAGVLSLMVPVEVPVDVPPPRVGEPDNGVTRAPGTSQGTGAPR